MSFEKDAHPSALHRTTIELPVLPVVRDIYCSQGTADKLIEFVTQTRPDLILAIANEGKLPPGLFNSVSNVVYYVQSEIARGVIPAISLLGMLDFASELTRRIRAASQLFQLEPRKLLVENIDGGWRKMPALAINVYTAKTVTQEMADDALNLFAEKWPDVWFTVVEAVRLNIWLYSIGDIFKTLFRQEMPKIFSITPDQASCIAGEVWQRAAALFVSYDKIEGA